MRWFTDEAYTADDFDWDAMVADYSSHVARLVERLPRDLAMLATDPTLNLHDASIHTMDVDLARRTLEMVVFLYSGTAVTMHCTDVSFLGTDGAEDDLKSIGYAIGATYAADHWGPTRTTVMAQEVDVAGDGRSILRLRLHPFYEFQIFFRDIELSVDLATQRVEPAGRLTISVE
jgi:hypothetical protein